MGLIKKVGTKVIGSPQSEEGSTREMDAPDTRRNIGVPEPTDTRRDLNEQAQDPAVAAMQMLSAGTKLQDRYLVEEPIGVGGMSIVYRGRDLRFKDVVRHCAIKEMAQTAPDSNTRALNLKNFQRESGLLATLQHPAIPKVYDFFEERGRIYLVLELIPGQDLETVLEEASGPLDEVTVGRWAVQILDVLTYLHNHRPEPIVFRDMKPSNVMLAGDRIVLIDFGIARNLNRSDRKGTMIGTEGYSPPEQYRGMAEPQGDVYALGATMHHLLTKSDPRLETPFTFQDRPIRQLNPAVSPDMEAIILRALEYDMAARWQSTVEMRNALLALPGIGQGVVADRPVGVAAATPSSSTSKTELVWKFTCEEEVRSSPFVSGGMLFIGCYDTNLYALDAVRGEFRWKYATDGGISSSPTVWQDYVYIGSEDGSIYAFDMRRGGLRWSFKTEGAVRSSARIDDRVLVVGSDDQHVYAIDGLRGSLMWKYRTWMPIRSSACIVGQQCYIGGNDGYVYCLDMRNGGIKWKQRTQQPVISSPAFASGLVIVGSTDNFVYGLDGEGGWPAWRFRTNHYVNSSPTVVGTRAFIGGVDGVLYALETKNGRVAWKYETGSQITSSPRVESGRVYFGAVDGNIYCLDAGSGKVIWKYATDAAIVSSPFVAEGIVYIGSMDHAVYALKA